MSALGQSGRLNRRAECPLSANSIHRRAGRIERLIGGIRLRFDGSVTNAPLLSSCLYEVFEGLESLSEMVGKRDA
jgi:hypothetical protein